MAQPKAGRPSKAVKYAAQIAATEDLIADMLPEIVGNLKELAKGVWIEEEDGDGKRRVYRRPPCRQSNEYLMNRIMGKPTDSIEISNETESGLTPAQAAAITRIVAGETSEGPPS